MASGGSRPSKGAVVRGSWLVNSTAAEVTEPTTFRLHDREWDLLPGVFAPTYCVSTGFFTESIPFPVGGSFLEVGCGSGVTAVTAAAKGCARVAATDISDAAVANTALNAARHGLPDRVELHHGDMFDGLGPEDRFDLIFWNSPFIDPGAGEGPPARRVHDEQREQLRQAVFDPGYRAHERYLSGARARLTAGGRLLLGFSDLGDHDSLRRLAAEAGYRISVLRASGDLAPGVDYQLLELVPQQATAPDEKEEDVTVGATFVPSGVRHTIAADPTVGGGNALEVALRVSPDIHAPYLHAELPVRDSQGVPREQLSLAELADLVGAWSAWYAGRGVGPRDRVGIYFRDSADDLIHYLALSRLGAIAVLVNGEMDPVAVLAYLRRTEPVGLQTDDVRSARIAGARGPEDDRFWVSSIGATVPPGDVPVPPAFRHAPGDPVLICHTSGTTGASKPVIWAHAQMMVGIRAHLTRFRDHPESLILSALPQSHGSAIGYALLAMLSGVPLALMSDRSGRAVAAAAGRYGATIVVGFAVTLAELALRETDAADLALVERWVSVADASHQAHVARLVERGRHWAGADPVPGSMFVDGFGSSELGWGGVLGMITIPGVVAPHRCLGVPQPFAEVAVLRADGTPADAGEVGLLGVKGPTVTPGYWNDSDKTYRSLLNGYWLSGDLVFRDEADRYYHVDRAADSIRTAGGMVYSVLTEEILLARLPEIDDCVVVEAERAGEVCAIALVQLRDGHGTDGMLARVNEILDGLGKPPLADVRAVDMKSVPVGVTGKVLKRTLRAEYATTAAQQTGDGVTVPAD
ncbi:AMP-binding protein [Streptomyces sp. NPDC102441]|uniref:AMP-binding protein n=1 Tax=Streptomyces sp. NPDC102441 TaxID=3366176 RepID=UPI00381148BA